jgi:bacillithiol synthase
MGCLSIPFQRLPHQPKLFLRFLNDFSSVSQFYPHPPSLGAILQASKLLDYPDSRRREVAAVLRETNTSLGSGEATAKNIDRLANGAVAVLSGQQVGLFGGPAYAFYKALSAIQIAHELTQSGVDAVPIFWMATEDHDLDEVRHVSWFHSGKRTRFELLAEEKPGQPVGLVKFGPAIEEITKSAAQLLGGVSSPTIAKYLQESYLADETYGSAFGKLFARVFADYGMILVDPLDGRLHRVAAPVFRKVLADRATLNAKLLQRDKDLEAAGFEPQVKVTPETTLLFQIRDGVRQPITYQGERGGKAAEFKIGDTTLSEADVLKLADTAPETLSPNALLRPVVQDYLFPTVAFCAGSAEISYLAQSEVLYREILGRMPVLLPRADFTILDAKADKLLQKYRLCIENLWVGPQQLRKQMESVSLPGQLGEDFDKKKALIDSTLTELGAEIQKLDVTLAGAVETTREKMSFQLNKLREKTGRALDERAGLIAEHSDFLENLLYPDRVLQSRDLSFLPFLAQWGPAGLEELKTLSASANLREHRIARITQ